MCVGRRLLFLGLRRCTMVQGRPESGSGKGAPRK
jgi:hypothetical protein